MIAHVEKTSTRSKISSFEIFENKSIHSQNIMQNYVYIYVRGFPVQLTSDMVVIKNCTSKMCKV